MRVTTNMDVLGVADKLAVLAPVGLRNKVAEGAMIFASRL